MTSKVIITVEGDVQVNGLNAHSVPLSQSEPEDGFIPYMERLAFTLDVASLLTGISYHKLIDYIAAGDLVSTKNGRVHLIRPDDLTEFMRSLPTSRDEAA